MTAESDDVVAFQRPRKKIDVRGNPRGVDESHARVFHRERLSADPRGEVVPPLRVRFYLRQRRGELFQVAGIVGTDASGGGIAGHQRNEPRERVVFVVADDVRRDAGVAEFAHRFDDPQRIRPTVDQVADLDQVPALGMRPSTVLPTPTEGIEEVAKRPVHPVDVTDDVDLHLLHVDLPNRPCRTRLFHKSEYSSYAALLSCQLDLL